MSPLEFTLRRSYGKSRYYPSNAEARALVSLTGRKCLNETELQRLQYAGFVIRTSEFSPSTVTKESTHD